MSRLFAWLRSLFTKSTPYPKGPLLPEVIRPPVGGCGITGCPNTRQHSHAADLVRRMKERSR